MDVSAQRNLDQSGQHFMIDKKMIKFIVDSAELKAKDVVLEIGYGKGVLTRELIKKSNVIAIDIEENELGIDSDKLALIKGNILEEFDELKIKYDFNKIVANIPYNISEPLFRKLFKNHFDLAILTIGKNFAEILTKKDNRLGMIADKLLSIKILRSVPKKAFHPQPRVGSMLISVSKIIDLDDAGKIYRDLLFLDNKRIKNAFEKIIQNESSMRKITKKALKALIKNNSMEEICSKKLYELDNKEFLMLDRFINSIK
jgi:16S rRNA (adenine1518-N6/adenine1519-N6)-dimethyltransferase